MASRRAGQYQPGSTENGLWALAAIGVVAVAAGVLATRVQVPAASPAPPSTSPPSPPSTGRTSFAHGGPQYGPIMQVTVSTQPPLNTLWGIASQFYHQATWWPALWAANEAIIGSNPNLLLPGQRLAIPPVAAAQAAAAAYYAHHQNLQAAQQALAHLGY